MNKNGYEYSEQEYLDNRKEIEHSTAAIEERMYSELDPEKIVRQINDKYGELKRSGKKNIKCYFDSDADDYLFFMFRWDEPETREEFENRMYIKKIHQQNAVDSMRMLIANNPDEAMNIVRELNLI